jgi:isopentenyl diphosphate isomerase/L-lactate dehydrogenase-like FMN-dependent dehydrogenase
MDSKRLHKLPTIEDCRKRARQRLPRFLFDFLDGGTEREDAPARNVAAFSEVLLSANVGRAREHPDLTTELFGRNWGLPFGVSPCGYIDLLDPGTEIETARAAEARGAPFILSMSSLCTLEACATAAPNSTWLQVVQSRNADIVLDIIQRAAQSGIKVLVVTMDVPMSSKRNRDLRNGFTLPLKPSLPLLWDLLKSPAWVAGALRRPRPLPGNFMPYVAKGASMVEAAMQLEHEADYVTTWDDFASFRKAWPGHLVAKGIQTAEDAAIAVDLGADGIIVSNHGGRQFDAVRPTICCLPEIVKNVGDSVPVMLDSGVRSGLDVLRALALGASMVFSGRAFYYAAGAIGRHGGAHAFDILQLELEIAMRQYGASSIEELIGTAPLDAAWSAASTDRRPESRKAQGQSVDAKYDRTVEQGKGEAARG